MAIAKKMMSLFDITEMFFSTEPSLDINWHIVSWGDMVLDFSQIAPEVRRHGYLRITHMSKPNHFCHTSLHTYWYKNVTILRLFRGGGGIFKHSSRIMIWECVRIVSKVIRSKYCWRRHTMHGNIVFSTHYVLVRNKAEVTLSACVQR